MYDGWFDEFNQSELKKKLEQHPIAYFCTEYGLNAKATMAGGLGVLAADTVREAHDRKFPMIAIGLFYHKGYRKHAGGDKKPLSPEELGLKPAVLETGERIVVSVPVDDKEIFAKAWLHDQGTIPIYFLDTDVEENEPWAGEICDYLYVHDRHLRLMQEIVLGIGGVRLLKTLGIEPSIYHMNDSYSALLVFEVAKNIMKKQNVEEHEAMRQARQKIAYTNHTLVAAGNDAFPSELVEEHLVKYAKDNGLNVNNLLSYGHILGERTFSMTMMALKTAGAINCVSRFHGEEAREIWPDFEIDSITNGIHVPTWDKVGVNQDLAQAHRQNKRELLEVINEQSGGSWQEDELLICWAKRLVTYKRPLALFKDITKLSQIVKNPDRPVRLIFAGLPHYGDKQGIAMMEKIMKYANNELKEHLTYIKNYSVDIAAKLVAGADVWLNTPKVGWEACGTSTMKAALNGTLLCSTKDGWLAEVGLNKIGWGLQSEEISEDLLDLLENDIIVEFYKDGRGKYSSEWLKKMNSARTLVLDDFATFRMLKEYIEKLYAKLINSDSNPDQ